MPTAKAVGIFLPSGRMMLLCAHKLSQELMQMRCAWDALLGVLPPWLRDALREYKHSPPEEIRLRLRECVEVKLHSGSRWLSRSVTEEDIAFVINTASRYSPWNAATVAQGYLTATGGHRIGICGQAVIKNGELMGIREPTSLCIRVAQDIEGIADGARELRDSILIIGAPCTGKTTLLRDLIRQRSFRGEHIAVVDERGEIFPENAPFPHGKCTDILRGASKGEGIPLLLRTMGASCIAVDEITEPKDCDALLQAVGCGVQLLATAHAGSITELKKRRVYAPLVSTRIFRDVLVLHTDKSWTYERMDI